MNDSPERGASSDSQGELFLVATPIGNLSDLSPRALDTLRACDRIVAEDTRRTRALLTHFGIQGKPIDSLHAHSSEADRTRLVEKLTQGEKLALVTDAGTPAVSDPGGDLVSASIASEIRVTPIPGPSAVLAALVASGLAGDGNFRFMGFLPREGASRHARIAVACETPEAVILFEAPNRTATTLKEFANATPERAACVARELTKLHEEFVRGTCSTLSTDEREWKGEIVIVLGPHAPEDRSVVISDADIDARIDAELAAGTHAKTIAERIAAWSGRPKRSIYERVVILKKR